jgi:hypothetical protein
MRAAIALLLATLLPTTLDAQSPPSPPPAAATQKPAAPATPARQKPSQSRPATTTRNPIRVRAFAAFGGISFQARDSFDAILGSHSGPVYGGGGQVLLPWNLYAEVGAFRFRRDGERAFVGPGNEVFPLGIPLEVSVTPIEITGGWRYRHCPGPPAPPRKPQPPPVPPAKKPPALSQSTQKPGQKPAPPAAARACAPRLIPYVGAGLSSYGYRETSEFADSTENTSDRFTGFHVVGGAEYRLLRLVTVGGEVTWSSIPDALGTGGVSAAFNENNLGGAAFRLKITVGR